MERRGRRRKAELVETTQKRKMLCKTRRDNLGITGCRSLSLFFKAAFAARDQFFKAGVHSPEPVDETMSGNKFHCKNM